MLSGIRVEEAPLVEVSSGLQQAASESVRAGWTAVEVGAPSKRECASSIQDTQVSNYFQYLLVKK